MLPRIPGHLLPHAAILAVVAFGTTWGIAAKTAVQTMPVTDFLFIRYTVAVALIAVPLLLRKHLRKPGRSERQAFALGIFDPGATTLLVFYALYFTDAVNAIIIAAWLPLLASIAAWWLIGERPSLPVVAGAAMGLIGIVLLMSDDAAANGSTSFVGDLLCIACQVTLAGSVALMRRINQEAGDPLSVAAWQIAGGTVTVAVVSAIDSGIAGRPWLSMPSAEGWLLVLYLALFLTVGSFWLYNYALRYLPTARVTLYGLMGPPLAVPVTAAVLGEAVSGVDAAALAVVLAGVALPMLAIRRGKPAAGP
jgi:probable blue pigment (indigoidine) exporter